MNIHSQEESEKKGSPAQTRRAIEEAALKLFSERGFAGTAVPLVAREAGIAAGTIYRHFKSKEELVNALFRSSKQALMEHLLGGFPFGDPPRAQFRAFWWRLVEFARAQPRAFAFLELHHHEPYLDAESRGLEVAALSPVVAFIELNQRPGPRGASVLRRGLPPAAVISMVWGAFVALFKTEQLGYLELDDALLREAEEACWAAIAAPAEEEDERSSD